MKFKKLRPDVELPEKFDNTHWINVRSNERIDVCSGDQLRVATGVYVTVGKNETAGIKGANVVTLAVTTGELFVTVHNPGKRSLMIYPSQILAEILVKKAPVKVTPRKPRKPRTSKVVTKEPVAEETVASEPRKTRLTSSARLVGYENK